MRTGARTRLAALPALRPAQLAAAKRDFPAPEAATATFMEGLTELDGGQRVVARFKRSCFRVRRHCDYAWTLHSLRLADEACESRSRRG